VIALEAAGVDAALILLLLAEGTRRQPFADLAIVLAVMSFAGAIAFVRFLERLRQCATCSQRRCWSVS
jgi:multisubunit Na+/H+ antiporter MnhF subunit